MVGLRKLQGSEGGVSGGKAGQGGSRLGELELEMWLDGTGQGWKLVSSWRQVEATRKLHGRTGLEDAGVEAGCVGDQEDGEEARSLSVIWGDARSARWIAVGPAPLRGGLLRSRRPPHQQCAKIKKLANREVKKSSQQPKPKLIKTSKKI